MARVKFGSFELDPFTGELWHGETRTHLQEQPLQVLICLLERHGKVVTREQLRQRVWGNEIHVNYEDGLNTAVSKLRQALDENADHPVLIETLPRKGYRFTVAAVEEPSGQLPALQVPRRRQTDGGRAPLGERLRDRWASRKARWLSGILGLGFLALGVGGWRWLRGGGVAEPPVMAILPLDGGRIQGAEDGPLQLAVQSLQGELGRVKELRLISMNSAQRAHEEGLPAQAFARRLGASAVLETSLQPAEDGQVVFLLNLVDGASGSIRWSERLKGEASEGAELGLRMARRVVERFNWNLPATSRGLGPTEEVQRYLLGAQRAFEQGGAEGVRKSEDLYRKAIALDPGSSAAHAGLSELLQSRCFGPWEVADPSKVAIEAEREARRAVEWDPRSAKAHLQLGECLLFFKCDAGEGEREIARGISLAPDSPAAVQSQAWLDLIHRRWDLAIHGFEQALRLNPLSCFAFDDLCRARFYAGQDVETLELVRRGLELGPEMKFLLRWRARSEARQGHLETAYRSYLEWIEGHPGLTVNPQLFHAEVAAAHRRGGYLAALKAIAHRLEVESRANYVPPFDVALFHAEAQDAEACLAWLKRGLVQGDPNLVLIRCSPGFDFLRGDPRFKSIAAQAHRGTVESS